MNISVNKVSTPEELQKCLIIRKKVFVEGQNVPLNEEVDGKDEQSEHYLLVMGEYSIGVARVRFVADYAKIERVAVLDEYQGRGFGKLLMEAILTDLKTNSTALTAKLGAQTYAIPFYEQLGFIVCSDEYVDAGIPHKDMRLDFQNVNRT
jgi:predicted GNAT family N-acyltransferase